MSAEPTNVPDAVLSLSQASGMTCQHMHGSKDDASDANLDPKSSAQAHFLSKTNDKISPPQTLKASTTTMEVQDKFPNLPPFPTEWETSPKLKTDETTKERKAGVGMSSAGSLALNKSRANKRPRLSEEEKERRRLAREAKKVESRKKMEQKRLEREEKQKARKKEVEEKRRKKWRKLNKEKKLKKLTRKKKRKENN